MTTGTNNVYAFNETDIAKGVREVVDQILKRQPNSRVILLGVLPRDGQNGLKAMKINTFISKYNDDKRVFYLDMSSHFQTAPGVVITDLYNNDKLHLSTKGYQVWHDVMDPLFQKLLNMY